MKNNSRNELKTVRGIGAKTTQLLQSAGISSKLDLLYYLPVDYLNLQPQKTILHINREQAMLIKVEKVSPFYFRGRLHWFKVQVSFESRQLELIFFNQNYLRERFLRGAEILVFGKPRLKKEKIVLINPKLITPTCSLKIQPVYRRLKNLSGGKIRLLIAEILKSPPLIPDPLPETILRKYHFPSHQQALQIIHQPDNFQQLKIAQNRLSYEELFLYHFILWNLRNRWQKEQRLTLYADLSLKAELDNFQLFSLTQDQLAALRAIQNDLKQNKPMRRVLHGEVGSGKTIVTFFAILLALKNGYQAALLAPTEILASQHYQKAKEFFKAYPIFLLTANTPEKERIKIEQFFNTNQSGLVIGTHALLNNRLNFSQLTMVVIDEQHRFGVSQRASLILKGSNVDLLVTTATPIPRTLLLTYYRDLQVSRLQTLPPGRKPVITRIIPAEQRQIFYEKIGKLLSEGKKGYLIAPRIESEDSKSVHVSLQSLKKELNFLGNFPHALVSSQTPKEELEKIFSDFRHSKLRLLIATTVVEVGVDIPDASFIIIENADRFGLAQLHQLRGRVGRSDLQAYCFLIASTNLSAEGKERLKAITCTNDGFKIAEYDFRLRGGGEIAGFEQKGFLDFKFADLKRDYQLFKQAARDLLSIASQKELWSEQMRTLAAQTLEQAPLFSCS